jgi:ABC-type lipoprotein release transport system permease subunit
MYLQMAWRNIWRNPRRTAVILTAVVIGVWSMIFLGGVMAGMYDAMIENQLSTLTGHLQIHHPGYRNDPVVEHSLDDLTAVKKALSDVLPPGAVWTDRVRVSAIAQNARHSAGVTLVGVRPEKEAAVSFIGHAVTEGRFLKKDQDAYGIVIGRALADDFSTGLGKKIILMSQGMDGEIQSRAFRVVGIFQAQMAATEKAYVFVTLPAAQDMLKMGDSISEVAVLLPARNETEQVVSALKERLPRDHYEVTGFRELMPLITAQIELWDTFMILWYVVIFVAMGFGITNTILMAVMERIREFGLIKSLGMRPRQIVVLVVLEGLFLLALGIVIGNLAGYASIWALAQKGIDLSVFAAGAERFSIPRIIYPTIHMSDVVQANLVVLVLGILVSLYPAVRAARITPVEALAQT